MSKSIISTSYKLKKGLLDDNYTPLLPRDCIAWKLKDRQKNKRAV